MMELEPQRETVSLGTTQDYCLSYAGAIPYDGRRVIPGSVVFQIGDPITMKTYFEGRPTESGSIEWTRKAGGDHGLTGTFRLDTGQWHIDFGRTKPERGEEITVTYRWQPHYLSGAEVMVRVNNEDRLVPIRDLQKALWSYLGD